MPPLIPAGSPAAAAATVQAGTIPPGMMPQNRAAKPGPNAKPKAAVGPAVQAPGQGGAQGAAPAQPNPQVQQGQGNPGNANGQPGAPQAPVQPATMGPAHAPPPKGVTRDKSGPVPGQSLTSRSGHPYERPPTFTDIDKAMTAILKSFSDDATCSKILNMMEIGIPVYAIVTSFMMQGYAEGKWNPDLALLLMEPMTALLIAMAKASGIEPEIGVADDEDPTLDQVAQKRIKISKEQVDAAQDAAMTSGIVDRPGKEKK